LRLNKFISNSGHCSRRAADDLIASGKVLVNNVPVKQMGTQVDPLIDQVRIKGGPIIAQPKKTLILLMNKPKGYVCTKKDVFAKRTVYELLPDEFQNLFSIGRLDKDSEGLLVFTNNGELAQKLSHPKFEKEKVYRVHVRGKVVDDDIEQIEKGMTLLEYKTAPAKAEIIWYNEKENRTILEITLKEGKKRQIRNMFLALKKPVKKLVRISFGKYKLNKMKPGDWMRMKY
jgi:23S rRNA pseudouridine2605 synthase